MNAQTVDKYFIVITEPDTWFFVGRGDMYEKHLSKALLFNDKYDALIYIEKRGIQKMSKIVKFKTKEELELDFNE